MTTFAPHRDTVEAFVDTMHGGADKDALTAILAENVVLYSPLGDEPITGRKAVLEAMQGIGGSADLTYKEVLTGETHHAAYFRLQIEDTVVDGMDYIPARRRRKDRRGDHLVAPAAGRRPDAAAPCGRARHEALGTRHPHAVAATRCQTPAHQPNKRKRAHHDQHQHHRLGKHGQRHRHPGRQGRQHRRDHRSRCGQGRSPGQRARRRRHDRNVGRRPGRRHRHPRRAVRQRRADRQRVRKRAGRQDHRRHHQPLQRQRHRARQSPTTPPSRRWSPRPPPRAPTS